MYHNGTTTVRGLTLIEALDRRRNEVWRAVPDAEDSALPHGDVAVKLLHPAYEPIVPHWLQPRARRLKRVVESGANWAPVLGHGHASDGRRYVVSPLYQGSLADQLAQGSTPWFPATALIADAAAVVAEAHAAGLAFGYLRPSTVLLAGASDVRLAAFGLSTRRFDDGTPQFMAPELAAGDAPIPASDVFSLSLILASLIAGQEIDHSRAPSAVIAELGGSVPDRIVEIIDYGLSANLRNRYADAGKMARALEVARHERPSAGSRNRTPVPPESVDPLTALLTEPLLVTDPDETPTAIPLDAPAVEVGGFVAGLDDPTDPGIAARRALDTETDHTGSVAHLESPPTSGATAPVGPLADLVMAFDGPDDPPTIQSVPRPPQRVADPSFPSPGSALSSAMNDDHRARGSIIDISDRPVASDNGTVPTVPTRPGPGDSSMSFVEPSRISVLADNVGHFVAMHRRRIASSATIIGITGVVGAALLVGAGDLLGNEVTVSGGTPVPSSVVESETTIDRSSPLNDQAPLDNARSLSFDDIPTTQTTRRTTAAPATATTGADNSSTTVGTTSSTNADEPTSTRGPSSTTSTTGDVATTTTGASSTTERPTTTTEASTSTTKRKGPPHKP